MNVASARKAWALGLSLAVFTSSLPLASFFGGAAPAPSVVTPADEVFPQFGVNGAHSFTPNVTGRGYNDTLLKWRLALSPSAASSVVANFSSVMALNNTTSSPNVEGVVLGLPGSVRIVAGNNGTPMWSYPILSNMFGTPIAADVNLDGKMDLVFRGDSGYLEAVTPNITWDGSNYLFPIGNASQIQAQQLWNRSLSGESSSNNNLSIPIALNIIGGPAPEILAPAGDRLFYFSGSDGTEIRNATVDGTIVSAPTAFRVGAGWMILVASTNRTTANLSTVSSDYIVTAFDSSLNRLWNASFPQSYATAPAYKSIDLQLPSPAAGNLDGAGPIDDWALVTPYENSLAQLRIFRNGSNAFSSNATLLGLTGASPAVTDLDGDGRSEIVTLSYEPGTPIVSPNSRAFLEVFAGNGTRLWNATIDELPGNPRENTLAPPAIADFNGDGVKDIVLFLTDGASEVRSGTNGSRIFRHLAFDQGTSTEFSGPAVADLDHDGYLDITANGAAVSFALADLNLNASDIALNNSIPDEFEDVSVTATIHNTGNANARNVSVEFRDGSTLLNETSLPFIAAGASALALVVVNFSSGGSRLLRVTADPNQTIEELDDTNNTAAVVVNVTSLYGFRFESPLNRTVVQPGFSYAFVLNTVSEASLTNLVNLSVGSLPANWSANLNPNNVSVTAAGTPSDTNTSFVSVTTDALATTGEYDIVVRGVSAYSPRNRAELTFTVVIGGQYGVSLYPVVAAENVTAGDTVTYNIDVLNAGNSDDTFTFTNTTPAAGWRIVLSRAAATIAAGKNLTLFALVTSPVAASSGESSTITVTARSLGDGSKLDNTTLQSTVVVPDLVVSGIRFYRECGGESVGGSPRLIQGDDTTIVVTLANIADNAEISVVHARIWIDGQPLTPDRTTKIGSDGTGTLAPIVVQFAGTGVRVVTVQADPNNLVSEVSESNNNLTEQGTVKDTNPVGPFTVSGYVLKDGLGVAGATVTVSNTSAGATLSTTSTGSGSYSITLASTDYADGDRLLVNATDGLDFDSESPCGYSEDFSTILNLNLTIPSPWDFLLVPTGPVDASGAPGSKILFNVSVTNRGTLNNTVLLSASGDWALRILDANGSVTAAVLVPPSGSVAVQLEVTVPPGGTPGTSTIVFLNGSAQAAPSRSRSLALNASIGVLRSVNITEDLASTTVLAGSTFTVNLTVRNLGNADDNFRLTATCTGPAPCGGWATLEFLTVSVPAGASSNVAATVRVSASAVGGGYLIAFAAAGSDDATVNSTTTFSLTATEVRYDFSVSSASIRLVPGEAREANLTVTNRGSVADTYNVSTDPQGSGYAVDLEPGGGLLIELVLGPGEAARVIVNVSAPETVDREGFDIPIRVMSGYNAVVKEGKVEASIGFFYDFRVTGPSLSETPEVDKEIRITATVANVGARSFVGSIAVRLYVDGQPYPDQTITNLPIGRDETVVFTWTPRVSGSIEIRVEVNMVTPRTVYESVLTNNVASQTVSVAAKKPSDFFGNRAVQLALLGIVVVLITVAALSRRKEEEPTPVDHEKATEESEERRIGKGPGGLERL